MAYEQQTLILNPRHSLQQQLLLLSSLVPGFCNFSSAMHFCWALLTAHFKGSSLWVFSFPLHCISWWCKTNCGWCCCWGGLLVGWLVGWLWFLLPWFVWFFFHWLCQMLHAFLDSANLTVDDAVVGVWLFVCLLCFLLPPPSHFFSPEFFSCSVQFSLAGELWSRWLCCCLCRESVCSCFSTPISCQLQLPHYQSLTGKYSLLLECVQLEC